MVLVFGGLVGELRLRKQTLRYSAFVEMMAPAIMGTLFNTERRQMPSLSSGWFGMRLSALPSNKARLAEETFRLSESSEHPLS